MSDTPTTLSLYIAGPMRGRPQFNFPLFDKHLEHLEDHGHEAFSPAERDRAQGFDPVDYDGTEDLAELGFSLRHALSDDTSWICQKADGVVVLPEWYLSIGAKVEVALALALGLPIYYADFDDEPGSLAGGLLELPKELVVDVLRENF